MQETVNKDRLELTTLVTMNLNFVSFQYPMNIFNYILSTELHPPFCLFPFKNFVTGFHKFI